MARRFTAILLVSTLVTAGVLAFNSYQPAPASVTQTSSARMVPAAYAADPIVPASAGYSAAEIDDFKTGFADGFSAGVMSLSFPAENEMARSSRAYLDGFSQGYTEGQNKQGTLRAELCEQASAAALAAAPAVYRSSSYRSTSNVATTRTLGERYVNEEYYEPREVDRGIGSTARKALLIAGGAAAGAGIGGAVGGKKGALIGVLAGGGTGTALAYTKKPSRAFNRKVSGKNVAVKTAIGAGAGAAIGAIAGGKRGALAGLALGGGGGALWGLMSGKKTRR